MLRKNVASQVVTFTLVNATTGAALTSATVTTKVTLDGTQSASAGTLTELTTGQYKYVPTQGETNGASVGFSFTATNAVPVNLHCFTIGQDPAATTFDANATKILGTAVSTPATAGILDVNVKNMNNVAATAITTIKAVQGLAVDGVVPTVTTVTNQLTAAAIATGIWQDTTAGDFTTAASVGKSVMNGVALGTGLTVNAVTGLTASNLDAAISTRMATYTQPTGFLAATFPTGTIANTTNITAGTITTVTTVTNQLSAAAIATGVWTDTTAGDFTTALSVGKSVMNGVSLGTGLTVAAVSGAVGSVTGAVGSVTGAVGSVTGAVGSVTGAVGSVTGLTAATVHADLDDIQARLPAALTANGNIKADTLRVGGTVQTAGDLAVMVTAVDDFVDTEIGTISTGINAILALLDDPRTEPGQSALPVNPDMATKVDYIYKFLRNRKTNDGTTTLLYADNGTTVDHKQTTSEAAGTVEKAEWVTGP